MAESSQSIAKRILTDLETLLGQGRLQAGQIDALRSELGTIANPPAPPVVARRPPSTPQHKKQFKAIWSYNGTQADELSFVEGDRIELSQEISEGWSKGCVVRSDGSRSDEGMFPSNYVEVIAEEASITSGTALSPPLPPRVTPSSASSTNSMDTGDEKRAGGIHDNRYQILTPWQPGVPRWSSGGPPLPPPSPSHFNSSPYPQQSPSNTGYYNQPPMPYGPNTPDAYGPGQGPANSISSLQPVPVTDEDKKKHDKVSLIL
jgi:hypothetical protein